MPVVNRRSDDVGLECAAFLTPHYPLPTPEVGRVDPGTRFSVNWLGTDQRLQIDVDQVESAGHDEVTGPEEAVVTLERQPLVRELIPPVPVSLRPGLERQSGGRLGFVGIR